MIPPTDSPDPTPESVKRSGSSATDRRSQASTIHHLEAALVAEDDVEKNYHIRSALQRMMVDEERRPGRGG